MTTTNDDNGRDEAFIDALYASDQEARRDVLERVDDADALGAEIEATRYFLETIRELLPGLLVDVPEAQHEALMDAVMEVHVDVAQESAEEDPDADVPDDVHDNIMDYAREHAPDGTAEDDSGDSDVVDLSEQQDKRRTEGWSRTWMTLAAAAVVLIAFAWIVTKMGSVDTELDPAEDPEARIRGGTTPSLDVDAGTDVAIEDRTLKNEE